MSNAGLKNDQEKPRMELVPAGATLEIAKVLTFGAKKYAPHNWRKGFEYSRLIGALERHIAAFKEGEDLDPESGLPHMAHAGCCVMFLIEHQLKGYGTDDRYKSDTKSKFDKFPDFLLFDLSNSSPLLKINDILFKKEYDSNLNIRYLIPIDKNLKEDYTFNYSTETYYGEGLYAGIYNNGGIVEVFATWRTGHERDEANV